MLSEKMELCDTERYRSGHNGTDSKSVDGQPSVGSNPTRSAIFIGMWLSLVEHYVRDVGAAGSNPVIPTTAGCSAGGSALDWGSRCRRFKSCHSDQFLKPHKRLKL